jgi:glycerol kinase
MAYILALDEGTTSARAMLFDNEGQVRGAAQREFPQHFPQAGWVEHDAVAIWDTQLTVAREAFQKTSAKPGEIVAIGITNQRETTVVWDRESGRPVGPAIVWQDRRTAPLCEKLKADGCEPMIQERTGLLIDAYFSASKVAWILDNTPGAKSRAESGKLAFGTIDSWLIWKLTNGTRHVTDASNASRTMLFNIRTGRWDEELLRLFAIPASMLPEVTPSSGVVATTDPALGLGAIRIAGNAGDQQAALFGQACLAPGQTKTTYGTGCFMLQTIGSKAVTSRNRLLTTVAWRMGDVLTYAVEGSVFIGGAVVQWLRDGLGIIRSSAEVEELARSVPDSGGVLLVPAFSGLGAPHWDPFARGALVGLTRGTTKAHLARAALESIAFQVADLVAAMQADSGLPLPEMRVDGGAARNDLLMQFQADLLGVPLIRPVMTETTAIGAAYLAGLAVGFWKSPQEIAGLHQIDRRFEPLMPRARAQLLQERWQQAVERAKHWETPQSS